MSSDPTVRLSRLREIGWAEWDPIGLVDSDCPRDEYDSYLLQVAGRLRRGESIATVTNYLVSVEVEVMGLGTVSPAGRASTENVVIQIKDYLDTLPPGPLRVR